VLHRELVFPPSNHLTVDVSGAIMSRRSKMRRLLQPNKVSELIVDTDGDEVRVSSNVISAEDDVSSV
jgi:hypothetical protein